jgi:hypothetical protein
MNANRIEKGFALHFDTMCVALFKASSAPLPVNFRYNFSR